MDVSHGGKLNLNMPVSNKSFGISSLRGWGETYNVGAFNFDGSYGGNSYYGGFFNPSNHMNYFSDYKSLGFGYSVGSPFGGTVQRGKTFLPFRL